MNQQGHMQERSVAFLPADRFAGVGWRLGAKLKLGTGFPIKTFGNDKVLLRRLGAELELGPTRPPRKSHTGGRGFPLKI